MKRVFIPALLSLITGLLGCDSLKKALEEQLGCSENETQTCICPNGEQGIQLCDPTDGGTWQACVCLGDCVASPEECDEVDNDCDGETDEEVLWVIDVDGDRYDVPLGSGESYTCDAPPVGAEYIYAHDAKGEDCDDSDPTTYAFDPASPGSCLACIDQDTDLHGDYCVDGPDCDDDPVTGHGCNEASECEEYFADGDGDLFGAPDAARTACVLPSGYVENNDDCDDDTAPDACGAECYPNEAGDTDDSREICDGFDNDCNPETRDGIGIGCEYGCDPTITPPGSAQCFACEPGVGCCYEDGTICANCCNGICDSVLAGWEEAYRIRLTIDAHKVPGVLHDFPVYVNLSDFGSHFFEEVEDEGEDIRVTASDGVTMLSYELVSLDKAGGTGELYFQADTVYGATNTTFFVYYGNSTATAPSDTGAWEGYTRVWHLNEESAAARILNSVNGVEEGTIVGSNASTEGLIGWARLFDDDDSYVEIGHESGFDFIGAFTLSAWVRPTNSTTNTIFKKGDETLPDGFSLSVIGQKVRLVSGGVKVEDSANLALEKWSYVVVTWDGGELKLYVNGGLADSNSSIGSINWATGSSFTISQPGSAGGFDGLIDEARIVNGAARSADWITAEYVNIFDREAFYSARVDNCEDESPEDADCSVDRDGDGFISQDACPENGNDCDDSPETGALCSSTCETYYADGDGDQWGNTEEELEACSLPDGYIQRESSLGSDCDDTAAECRDNCVTYYTDADGDGHGRLTTSKETCAAGDIEGWVAHDAADADCNDSDPLHWTGTYPSCDEDCTDVDGDGRGAGCDLGVDCDDTNAEAYPGLSWYADGDGDGYGAGAVQCTDCGCPAGSTYSTSNSDCDDDPLMCGERCKPSLTVKDVCDGYDNDCDGESEEDPDVLWYPDADSDGYTVSFGTVLSCAAPTGGGLWTRSPTAEDCAPENPACNEDCGDNDRDGTMDCDGDECIDKDKDGYGVSGVGCTSGCCSGADCDDNDDLCHDGCEEYYKDFDGDGYVVLRSQTIRCRDPDSLQPGERNEWIVPDGEVLADCDDDNGAHWSIDTDSSGENRCDMDCVDKDTDDYGAGCDMGTDCNDEDSRCAVCNTYYADLDRDGRGGRGGASEESCDSEVPDGLVDNDDDCDDGDKKHWTMADGGVGCDDATPLGCVDNDGDGYGEGCDLGPDCDDNPETGWCHDKCTVFYEDKDGDGYGAEESPEYHYCEEPMPGEADAGDPDPVRYSRTNDDCDDANESYWSRCAVCKDLDGDGWGENCDFRGDCDDQSDLGYECNEGCELLYLDADRDGRRHPDARVMGCVRRDSGGNITGYPTEYALPDTADVDCDDNDPNHWSFGSVPGKCDDDCVDNDSDGRGDTACDLPDCDDGDPHHWEMDTAGCDGDCVDADTDYRGANCDEGEDCNDSDPEAWTFNARGDGCARCHDEDGDGYGPGCDKGEDCDETNPFCHEGCGEYYLDEDDDGYGVADSIRLTCQEELDEMAAALDGGRVPYIEWDNPAEYDCNDGDANHWSFGPNADAEHPCDNDCIDEDGDFFGEGCDKGRDCDDTPGQGEGCNPDAAECLKYYPSLDGDDYAMVSGYTMVCLSPGTCPLEAPGRCLSYDELIDVSGDLQLDGDDDDCDDTPETGGSCYAGCTEYYQDMDNDGYGDPAVVISACPHQEIDGFVEEENTDCDDGDPLHWSQIPGDEEACDSDCEDPDGDGYGPGCDLGEEDCDNTVTGGACHPGGDACRVFYLDSDNDGYGDPLVITRSCSEEAPDNYADNADDCDPLHPRCPSEGECVTYCYDKDGDGQGSVNAPSSVTQCVFMPPPPDDDMMINCNDCDDRAAQEEGEAHPGAACGYDECEEFWYDGDQDGWGDPNNSVIQCPETTDTQWYVRNAKDCDVQYVGRKNCNDGNVCTDDLPPDDDAPSCAEVCVHTPECPEICVPDDQTGFRCYEECVLKENDPCCLEVPEGGVTVPEQIGYLSGDLDGDGHCNAVDNCYICDGSGSCVDTPNTSQSDYDGDEIGDVCDPCPFGDDCVPLYAYSVSESILLPAPDGYNVVFGVKVVNGGDDPLSVSDLRVRYWFSADTPTPPALEIDTCLVNDASTACAPGDTTLVYFQETEGSDHYMEIALGAVDLSGGAESSSYYVEISEVSDSLPMIVENDQSYLEALFFTQNINISVYADGVRVQGVEPDIEDYTPCSDGDACTVNDTYFNNQCSGSPRDCDDGNVCTDDSCDAAVGCVHDPNTASCDDGDLCTEGDVCAGGVCTSSPVDCDDGNVCTDDSCDAVNGCEHDNNTASCDDGDMCTEGDVCAGGACTAGSAVDCDDSDPCTDDSCDMYTGCVHVDNGSCCTPATYTFRMDENGYSGVTDIALKQADPGTAYPSDALLQVTAAAGVQIHGLIRFDNLLGSGAGQIPPAAIIESATLTFFTYNGSTEPISIHRMLADWSDADTWNSLNAGITADGTEALATPDDTQMMSINETYNVFSVTDSLVAWQSGANNRGWGLLNSGADIWSFVTSQGGLLERHPLLTVEVCE
jgi:hypothetical protein